MGKERLTCPKCGAVGHNVKSVHDKSKVLSYMGNKPMYGKKMSVNNVVKSFNLCLYKK